jgi:hypothetical protein
MDAVESAKAYGNDNFKVISFLSQILLYTGDLISFS